jgi:hypothetical protein
VIANKETKAAVPEINPRRSVSSVAFESVTMPCTEFLFAAKDGFIEGSTLGTGDGGDELWFGGTVGRKEGRLTTWKIRRHFGGIKRRCTSGKDKRIC